MNGEVFILKKYKGLVFITLFLVSAITIYGNIFKSQIKTVDTITLTPCKAESFVVCTGKIEHSNKEDVYIDSPCIIDEICVNIGDKVSKGDELLKFSKIDMDASPSVSGYYADQNLQQVYSNIVKKKNLSADFIPSNQLKKNTLVSPISGIISSIQVENNLPADEKKPVITISNGEKLSVLLNVNESKISDIKIGQEVIVSGIGFKNKEYIGVVRNISSEAKTNLTATGQETSVEVIVDIDKSENDNTIKPGFTAKCKIITDIGNAMLIPYESVKADEEGKEYVFTVCNGLAKKTYIKTGREFDNGFEIVGGISSNDLIIFNPDLVKNSDKVKVE